MTVKKPPTDWDAVTERARKALAGPKDEGPDIEAQWKQWNERKRQEEVADVKRAQRELLRSLDLPSDALEMVEKGQTTGTAALEAQTHPVDILVLSGAVGSGKTIAAVTWLYAWVMDKRNWHVADAGPQPVGRCLFVTAPQLQRAPRFDVRWVERLTRATRLVVDDLGAEYVDDKGVFTSLVQEVVNERHARRRATLITTNLAAPEFKARYGERVADRIRERGRFVVVGSKSLRGAKR